MWRLSGLEPFRDGELLILPNRKIPQILLLTIYDIGYTRANQRLRKSSGLEARSVRRGADQCPVARVGNNQDGFCGLPSSVTAASWVIAPAGCVFRLPSSAVGQPDSEFRNLPRLGRRAVWFGHGPAVDAAPHACSLS